MHLQDAYRSRLLLLSNRLLTYIFYRRKSSPLKHDPQSGHAADVTFLTEIAKFTNFVFFRQIFMRICHNVSPFVLYIITVAETPPPPFPLSEGEDTSLNNTSSKQHCCYATLYKWSTPCKFWLQRRRNMGEYAFDLFVVIFAIFVILAVSSGAFLGLWFAC